MQPKTSSALKAYLDHLKGMPHYEYPRENGKISSYTPTPQSAKQRQDWDQRKAELASRLAEGELNAFRKAEVTRYCQDENQCGVGKEHPSPSGRFRLVVTAHRTEKGSWGYTRGKVYEGGNLVATVCRNYSMFPFAWVENHPKGHFLVCGEDYQGQTVVNLESGQVVSYLPEAADEGCGFCWADIHPSPDGLTLAVEGCYWACPYEVRLVDFTDPMNPPWLELGVADEPNFAGWQEDNTCLVGILNTYVNAPGHPLHGRDEDSLSPEETDAFLAYEQEHALKDAWREEMATRVWARPSYEEVVRNWVDLMGEHVLKTLEVNPKDWKDQWNLMWNRLTLQEQQNFQEQDLIQRLLTWAK